ITPDPIAVVRGAPHKELAIRFMQFVLSEQGQRLWITRAGAPGGPKLSSLRRLPIAPAVYKDMRDFADRVDPYGANLAFPSSPARKKTFTILATLIELSCVDLLEELLAPWRAILAAHPADRAATLDQRP